MQRPQVIVLNGCSSSGKTRLARALQEALPYQYLNFSIDSVLDGLPPSDLRALQTGEVIRRAGYDWAALVRAYHFAIPGLLQSGLHLIIDNAWCEADETRELLTELAGYQCVLVGLDCALNLLQEREIARADRAPGLAAWEFGRVHCWMRYDLRFDSGSQTPEQIAEVMARQLQDQMVPTSAAAETLEALLLA